MSTPIFLHIMSTGDIWASNNISDTPTGTVLATFRVNSDSKFQKIGTLSGSSGSYAVSGGTGKWSKELT